MAPGSDPDEVCGARDAPPPPLSPPPPPPPTRAHSPKRSPAPAPAPTATLAPESAPTGSAHERPKNLDSGYAWLILLVMFLLQSSISGSGRVYGIVYAREVATGYYDREQASWPIATASAVENLAGMLTPALAQWLSWRQMEFGATSLLVAANLLAWQSSSLALDIVTLGLIQGLALSTCTVLSLVINNDYFERYRTTAYGIQMSGSTFGVLYLGPLVTWILETNPGPTNFRLVYLALGGVFACNLLLVLFIKPREQTTDGSGGGGGGPCAADESPDDAQLGPTTPGAAARAPSRQASSHALAPNSLLGRKLSRFEAHFERKSSVASVSYSARSRRQSILSRVAAAEPARPTQQQQLQLQGALAKSKSGVELARAGSRAHELAKSATLMKKISLGSMGRSKRASLASQNCDTLSSCAGSPLELSRQSSLSSAALALAMGPAKEGGGGAPFYPDHLTGAELDSGLARKLSALELASASEQLEAQQREGAREPLAQQAPDSSGEPGEQADGFSLALVRNLLRLPYLHCTWIMLALYYLIARILVIILVDFACDHGAELADATELLNYWSLGELVGRVLLGSLIDLKFLSCKACIVLTCSLLAALLATMVLIESYLVYAACSFLVAALVSLEYMLINVLMVEYLGKRRVTSCYSLAACLASGLLFARPTLIGLFRDQLGTYDGLLLLLAGLAGTFALLFYLLEPLLVRRWPKCGPAST